MLFLCFPKTQMSSCIAITPGNLSVIWSILIWKMSWAILKLKGILRNLYLPLWVLNVVRCEDAVSRCMLQNPSLASNLEKMLLLLIYVKFL